MSREKSLAPAANIKALTTSDTVALSPRPRGIMLATAGAVAFVNADDSVTTVATGVLLTGIVYPLTPVRINATGTDATLLGIY